MREKIGFGVRFFVDYAPILISPTPEATATLRMIVAEVTKEPAFERASVNCL